MSKSQSACFFASPRVQNAGMPSHDGTSTEPQGHCCGEHFTFITIMLVIFILWQFIGGYVHEAHYDCRSANS